MQEEWTEKYRPKSLSDVQGNESGIRALKRWAESWARGKPRMRAIILRGDPGTGKTSSALALANDMGWDHIEMNASDHRNAAAIHRVAGAGSQAQTFTSGGDFLSTSKGKRKLVIIDEADNLFGREDYGGSKAIVETIRAAEQPVVLIVNDYRELSRKAPAIRYLAESVTFKRIDSRTTAAVLKKIARAEEFDADEKLLSAIAENAGGDLRAAINDFQMLTEGRSECSVEDSSILGKRNQVCEMNAALAAMYSAKTAKGARDATLDLDRTPDDLEKWVDESIPHELRHPADMASGFDALSRSDVYLGRTRRHQYYGFWSYAKELMTGGVSLSRTHGQRTSSGEYRFPGHFIVMSRAKGARNTRNSVLSKLASHTHTSMRCANESTLPFLAALARRDREFLMALTVDLDLGEEDIAYLLGTSPDSPAVEKVFKDAKGVDASPSSGKEKKKRRSGPAKRRIGDF